MLFKNASTVGTYIVFSTITNPSEVSLYFKLIMNLQKIIPLPLSHFMWGRHKFSSSTHLHQPSCHYSLLSYSYLFIIIFPSIHPSLTVFVRFTSSHYIHLQLLNRGSGIIGYKFYYYCFISFQNP